MWVDKNKQVYILPDFSNSLIVQKVCFDLYTEKNSYWKQMCLMLQQLLNFSLWKLCTCSYEIIEKMLMNHITMFLEPPAHLTSVLIAVQCSLVYISSICVIL